MSTESSDNAQPSPQTERPHEPTRQLIAPIIGTVLILAGIVAFAENLGWNLSDNWGGVLFLVPAGITFYTGWRRYESRGRRVDANVFSLLAAGVICTASFVIIFFGLSQQLYGPVVLIAIGLALLIRHYWGRIGA